MYVLKSGNLKEVLELWSNAFKVYAPTNNEGEVMLLPYKSEEFTMEYINFAAPVKEYIFKQKETMFCWTNSSGKINVQSLNNFKDEKTLYFGIRPCDAYGISYLDEFFLKGYKDEIYSSSRKNGYIVAINCIESGENCFCSSMGTGPFAKCGYDLLFTPLDDSYLVEVGTHKGRELIVTAKAFFAPIDYSILSEKKEISQVVADNIERKINKVDIKKVLNENFESKIWDELSKDCIGCTGCTSLCPTCTCFNVVEENNSCENGCRVRYWDSCQSDSFTRNAGEHNPRNSVSRVRYRIYDKFKYIEEKFNLKGCTGCGRCINVCPANINVVNIINKLSSNTTQFKKNHEDIEKTQLSQHESCESQYKPQIAVITNVIEETKNIKRFIMQYEDKALHDSFKFTGQFFEITVFGVGEIAISIPFSPSEKNSFEFCIKKVGKVTDAIHKMKIGDKVGLRGPFGKGFPYEEFKGRDVIIIGSGVGMAPVRTMILSIIENREDFGRVVIIGSALSYEDLIYKDDLIAWGKGQDVRVLYALSKPTDKVNAHVGYINDLLPDLNLNWKNTSAIICASPRRIKATAKDLLTLGMKGADIYTSLETHMRCGIGKCGHCKVGHKYMCVDGPVFNYEEMLELPPEF